MQPDQAGFLLSVLAPLIENEYATTKKVVAAIPEDRREYRPEENSRTAFELAWHVVSSDIHFLEGVTRGEFPAEEPKMPIQVRTVADIAAHYEAKMPDLIRRLRCLTGDQLARPINAGPFNQPAVTFLLFMLNHAVHHRGWLCAYLRPMGAKVPSVYGPSHDASPAIAVA